VKIAIVLPGGVDRSGVDKVVPVYLWLIKRLSARHIVHVFALRQEPGVSEWDLLGTRVHNIGTERGRGRRFLSQFNAEHRRGAFDVMHAILGWEAAYASAASWWHGVPLLFSATGGEFVSLRECGYGMRTSLIGRMALRIAVACARRVTVASQYMQTLAASLGIRADIIPLGAAVDEWPTGVPRARDPSRPARLLHIGDIRPVKDQATLLAAVNQLRDSGVDVELDIVGADTMNGTVQQSAAANRLGPAVRWHGVLRRPELRSLMNKADLLVVTSRHEAGPIVLLEAAVAGVPAVGTAVGHFAEWAPAAASAVPVGDYAALSREIAALIADDERRLAVAREAQRRALAIDADFTAAAFEQIYAGLVVDLTPTGDPFLHAAQLSQSVSLPVFGIPVRFETNSRYVRRLIVETFARPEFNDGRAGEPGPALRVGIAVREGSENSPAAAAVTYSCPDETRVLVQTAGSRAVSDPLRNESIAFVTTVLVADRGHFRTEFLEAITFALVSHFDRHPVHAAAIARNGRAVLLAGPGGTGKSTLAYLAQRNGITVMSDDRVWVQLEPRLKIWAAPGPMRLGTDSIGRFPELRSAPGALTPAGAAKQDVPLAARPYGARLEAGPAKVCILERTGRASLERIPPGAVAAALSSQLAPGFDRFPGRVNRVFDALAAGGGWRLTLSDDPYDALPFLRQMLPDE
jgi:glycosyltransferase involved in cell wall biosynthesis